MALQQIQLYPNEKITPWGIERKCPRCGEWWPVDPEPKHAFHSGFRYWPRGNRSRNLYSYCTACNCEIRKNRYHEQNPNARYYKQQKESSKEKLKRKEPNGI